MGLALIPSGAHLFEMPAKLGLDRDAYFLVQSIYAGWALFAVVDIGALIATLLLAISLRRQAGPFRLALVSFASVIAFFVVFFTWTFPANQATANWTTQPDNWEALRRTWEYSHAANAGILFLGFFAATLAVVHSRE
jgi:hypothetical protein